MVNASGSSVGQRPRAVAVLSLFGERLQQLNLAELLVERGRSGRGAPSRVHTLIQRARGNEVPLHPVVQSYLVQLPGCVDVGEAGDPPLLMSVPAPDHGPM